MSTPAHMISGAYLGVLIAHVAPHEISYIVTAFASAGVIDLDHLYYFAKDWRYYRKNGFIGKMYKARSIFHELFGFTFVGALMLILSLFDLKLAYVLGIPLMTHITQDLIMGKSIPLAPFEQTEIQVVRQNMRIKAIIDVLVILVFLGLWLQYLKGAY